MAAHPPRSAAGSTSSGTRLLIALQRAPIAVGIFVLTGAADGFHPKRLAPLIINQLS